MKLSKLTEPNVISIWLGSITDFGDLDTYIWDNFENDFGVEFEERTAPEIDAQKLETPVKDLMDGFSFSNQWIELAVELCHKAGWKAANCAVVLFNVRYQPNLARAGDSCPIRFVGNVEWVAE